ncbi:hypothetical protein QBC44DRAFT_357033 [Cladorrhinum sp. PSN332]|nr:hypothetical protein QBC44DRAFT_357033 [Cladorrhinum sp. PSN332]
MILELPVIFLLPTNLDPDELHELEEQIPTLTYDINEAEIVVGKISKKQRALFELRKLKLATEEVDPNEGRSPSPSSRPAKRIRISTPAATLGGSSDLDSDTASEAEIQRRLIGPLPLSTIKVVKLGWLADSLKAKRVLPLADYVVYEGRKVKSSSPRPPTPQTTPQTTPSKHTNSILQRALQDASSSAGSRPHPSQGSHKRNRGTTTYASHPLTHKHPPTLLHQTTSDHESSQSLPPIPPYLGTTYSCQRPTPANPPNQPFISELLKIRTARTLQGDKIGVRAYSSAIAAIAAYPYLIQTPAEVSRLPGCGAKIALLYQEFKESGGRIQEARLVDETGADSPLKVINLFYNIWGVGETTAREFYYKRGWRDLDDVIEHGWDDVNHGLTRVQQIGVKYYDEFLLKIPRKEVEEIAGTILKHANLISGGGWQMVIVGGYRRGKLESGDVDVVLSHPDENVTRRAVERIVVSLERGEGEAEGEGEGGYITHTLLISTANSERGQVPVAWKGDDRKSGRRTGFDTLDKALVVWQDPRWEKEGGEKKKNMNPHRRVDIIISPWKTAGCAVLGWTSGTTFQRDLRRYCKKEKGLKFDSSGIRGRKDGRWVDLESDRATGERAPDMLTAERRVFEGIGLEWREPEERCTG